MGFDAIFTSISLGLLATTSPCVLPLYPGYLAYLSGGQAALSNRQYGRAARPSHQSISLAGKGWHFRP